MDSRAQRRPVWDQAGKSVDYRPQTRKVFLRSKGMRWVTPVISVAIVISIVLVVLSGAGKLSRAVPHVVLILTGLLLLLGMIFVPRWQAKRLGISDSRELFDKENEARRTIAQIIGGLAILVTLNSTNQTLSISQQQLRVANEGQVTERFTKAIEQLGATDASGRSKIEVRLGGNYGLARIANDSPSDRRAITEILSAYVRQHAPMAQPAEDVEDPNKLPAPPAEIQSILTVLGRRSNQLTESAVSELDLTESNLVGIRVPGGHLDGAILLSVRLDRADLRDAHLANATLFDSYLNAARLDYADLTNADLRGAHMHNTTLRTAKLTNAKLQRADLNHADVREADFAGADLTDADFTSVDLRRAHGLCEGQLHSIIKGRGTIVPKSLPPCKIFPNRS